MKKLLSILILCAVSASAQVVYTNIQVGTTGNDGTGDSLRSAFQKVNYGFASISNNIATNSLASKLDKSGGTATNVTLVGTNLVTARASGALARALEDRFSEVFNVLDYGADPTGVTNSATAMQAAANATAGRTNSIVLIPPGVYTNTATVIFSNQVTVFGYGATIRAGGNAKRVIQLGADGLVDEDRWNLFSIRGVKFVYGASTTSNSVYVANKIARAVVADCDFRNTFVATGASEVYFAGDNWESVVQDCFFYPAGSIGSRAITTNPDSLTGTPSPNSNIKITGNTFSGLAALVEPAVDVSNTRVLIAHNNFNRNHAIHFRNATNGVGSIANAVLDNTFESGNDGTNDAIITYEGQLVGARIEGNYFNPNNRTILGTPYNGLVLLPSDATSFTSGLQYANNIHTYLTNAYPIAFNLPDTKGFHYGNYKTPITSTNDYGAELVPMAQVDNLGSLNRLIDKQAIDTEAEFEALLFTLPEGGGGAASGDDIYLNGSDINHPDFDDSTYIKWVLTGTNLTAYATNLTAAHLATDSVSADELNATGIEAELEAVLDLNEQQGQIGDAQIADGAVDGGSGGEIADASVTADDLGADSVSASELNATGVEAELEAVQDLQDFQGAVTDAQVPNTITVDLATLATTATTANAVANNSVTGAGIALGSDAAGDIMYYNGTDYVRLAKGTAGQVLEMNAGATAPEWDTDDSGGSSSNWSASGTTNSTLPGIAYAHQGVFTNGISVGIGSAVAGTFDLEEGTAPALVANTFSIYAGTDVAAGGLAYVLPVAAASGIMRATDSSGVMTISHDGGFSHLAGTATDAQIPNTITIDAATLAATSTIVDGTDSTSFPLIVDSATGSLALKTDGGLLYDASNGTLSSTIFNTPTLTLTGTGTLNGLDAIDATTESTIEAAMDTLLNVTSIQGLTVTLADAGADAFFAWDDSASAYQNISAADARTAIESGVNILLETEVDSGTELLALYDDETGTGVPVFSTSPTLVTPILGVAAATSLTMGATNVTGELALKAPLARYRTIWIDAGAMVSRTTAGAASGTEETTTNDRMSDYFAFDDTTAEAVQFRIAMPDEWDRGTIKAKVFWYSASATTSHTAVWGVKAGAISNDDAIDAAWGTEVEVSDDVIAAGDLHVTAATGAITVGGTPALGDLVWFEIDQDATEADHVGDVKLAGVMIQYQETTSASAW